MYLGSQPRVFLKLHREKPSYKGRERKSSLAISNSPTVEDRTQCTSKKHQCPRVFTCPCALSSFSQQAELLSEGEIIADVPVEGLLSRPQE